RGKGVIQDIAEAIRLYRLAADQGLVQAQFYLGACYLEGRGIDKDVKEGFRLYRLAAEGGLVMAQVSLGLCYYQGKDIAEDLDAAMEWYARAATRSPLGEYYLGCCYLKKGEQTRGVGLIKSAADKGNGEAKKWLEENKNLSDTISADSSGASASTTIL